MKTIKTVMHTNIKLLIKSIIITLICLHNVSTYSQNFKNPESIVYDADRDRYIVSNKSGGYLSEINSDWEVSIMCKGCSSPKGLYIEGEKLYVATNKKVLIIDLKTDKIISSITIKEAQFLNDISSDKKGKIWVSDTYANKVFEIDTKTQQYKIFLDTKTDSPNGLYYNSNKDELFVAFWEGKNAISKYTTKGELITSLEYNGSIDGITFTKDGNLIFSNWYPAQVVMISPKLKGKPRIISVNHEGPADITVIQKNNKEYLLVPNFKLNSIDIFDIDSKGKVKLIKTIR